jgi:hemoglobin-like flavoprotein
MVNDVQKQLIQSSWKLVVPVADTAADLFYRRLFDQYPQYRSVFPSDMASQKKKLVRMLAFIVKALDWADAQWREDVPPDRDLMLVVVAMGRRHSDIYKIPDASYAAVGEALLWTFDYALGEAFTPEVRSAWALVYTLVAKAMRMGTAVVDRDAALGSKEFAQKMGEEALFSQTVHGGLGSDDESQFLEGIS